MSISKTRKTTASKKPRIVVVVGPTASGKSELAIYLARRFNGEVISADSRQVYRGMDIGTAKPKLTRRKNKLYSQGIRHYLMNIKDINQSFSVKSFKILAERSIQDIARRGKIPFVAGGTGLYIKALVDNLTLTETPPNKTLRQNLEKELGTKGLSFLYKRLIKLDPEAAYIVDPKNPRRVIRALEIALTQRKPLKEARAKKIPFFDALQIGISREPLLLKKRIKERVVKEMMKNGLVEEVKKLVQKYGANHEPLSALGYREIIDYINGKITLEEAIRQNQSATWRYAKKQLAWFKKDTRICWIKTKREAEKLVGVFIKKEKPLL